ncbi:uncharacterized protein LOC144121927 [Amblyomma americanum]
MIDSGSSGCLLRASAAGRCGARLTKDTTALYGFGSQGTPSSRAIGRCYTNLKIDGVKGEILVDMREGEINVPIFTSGGKDVLVKRGRRPGRVIEVDVVEIPDGQNQPACMSVSDTTEPKVFCVATQRRPIEDQQLVVGLSVTNEQKSELLGLLNEYRDCFANNISKLGRTTVLKMDITETHGSLPVAVRPYRTNAIERETIREIAGEWKRADIVSETSSP